MPAFISKDASRCLVGASSRLLLEDGGRNGDPRTGERHRLIIPAVSFTRRRGRRNIGGPRVILDTFRGKRKMGAISGLDKTPRGREQ